MPSAPCTSEHTAIRIQLLSDLHAEINVSFEPRLAEGADAVVAAGDIAAGVHDAMIFLRRHLGREVPVVMVAGNHEFYRRDFESERGAAREHAKRLGIAFLDDAVSVIGNVRFIGSTLWTDYDLFGEEHRLTCMRAALAGLMDHELIRMGPRLFTPDDARAQHVASRSFLETALAKPHAGPTVVVTHHGPHEKSVARRFNRSVLTPAFISDLAPLIEAHQPDLWVHGHTHAPFDYGIGRTRVICNPLGYHAENPAFDPLFVVDL